MIAPDGCAVEVYARLTSGADVAVIAAVIPPGGSVLDLGAGAGRLANPLSALGYRVVAVDEAPQMLARVCAGATTVCATIEELDLDRAFDVVLLASNLVNVPDDQVRLRFLLTCRRHLRAGGLVVIERWSRSRVDTAQDWRGEHNGVQTELVINSRPGPGLLSAAVTYEIDQARWTQSFTLRGLDDDELDAELRRAGLHLDRALSDDGCWIAASAANDAALCSAGG